MRCITAICAAGPPKLSPATRVQTRTASRKVTPCAGACVKLCASVALPPLLVAASFITSVPYLPEVLVKIIEDSRTARDPLVIIMRCHADGGNQTLDPLDL